MTTSARYAAPPAPGERLDFDQLYEQHFESIYRIVFRLSGGTDVDDLVQEVLMVVARRLEEFDHRAKVTTWVFQICHRVVLAHRRKRRVVALLAAAVGREIERAAPPRQLLSVERAEETRVLSAALDTLSWKKRVVILLHTIEGWTCEHIAECLGVPVGTVHTRLHHARKDLARSVERIQRRQR